MNVSPVILVIFLSLLAFAESNNLWKVYKAVFHKKSVASEPRDFTSGGSSYESESEHSDDSESSLESVNCSDLTSTFGRAMKWWLVTTSNRQNAPHVRFFLSSTKQPGQVEILVGEQFAIDWTDFKVERRTVFIVHGFKANGFKPWVKRMTDALYLWGDVNVVVVDWSEGQSSSNYYDAAVNTKIVGREIARFLDHVVNATKNATSPNEPKWGTLHLVGHSLGAHICGVAARIFQASQNNWKVARITGLDPAQPCFNNVSPEFRLDRTDATFVDIIHTSSSAKTTLGFGTSDPIGHVDFYPNGGQRQPGCSRRKDSLLASLKVPKTPIGQGKCSHQRAYIYFAESLVNAATGNCTFWAHEWDRSSPYNPQSTSQPCDAYSCTEMGIRAENHHQRGTFYVTTSTTPPFCIPSAG